MFVALIVLIALATLAAFAAIVSATQDFAPVDQLPVNAAFSDKETGFAIFCRADEAIIEDVTDDKARNGAFMRARDRT